MSEYFQLLDGLLPSPLPSSRDFFLFWLSLEDLLHYSLTLLNLPSLHILPPLYFLIPFSPLPTLPPLYPYRIFWATCYLSNDFFASKSLTDLYDLKSLLSYPLGSFFLNIQNSCQASPLPKSFEQPTQTLQKSLSGFKSSYTRTPSSSTPLLYITF